MRLLTIAALAATLSCGTRSVRDDGEPAADSEEPTAAAEPATDEPRRAGPAAHLALELVPENGNTAVRIVITDEVGATTRERIGAFEGDCVDISADVASDTVLLGVRCDGGRGVLLHVVFRAPTVTVLRDWRDDTEEAFDPIRQFLLPAGARVSTDVAR